MGYGNYSHDAHQALLRGRSSSGSEVFQQTNCHPLMNPKGVKLRESRDSAEHPNSTAIAFALDVTGSMGDIPRMMATSALPKFMKVLVDCKVKDPQVLFCAVGDATSDNSPLQVGQFETTAELMDQWLTRSFIEGGGGGSGEESYELAMYFLALHTEMDCVVKRKRRGFLFMTGDELPYPILSKHIVEAVIGDRLDDDLKIEEIVAELQKTFVPFFLVPDPSRRARCEKVWRDLLGDHVLFLEHPENVCYAAAGAVALCEGLVSDVDALSKILEATGAEKSQIRGAAKALMPLSKSNSAKVDGKQPDPPSKIKRLN